MEKPNILFITSDQQHWNTLGAFNSEISTPNLNRLVQQGTTFTRAYCPNPTCTPSRSSIITGMYPSQHGAWSLGTKLDESVHTVGEDFLSAGYNTALIGKAHFQPLVSTEQYVSLEAYPTLHNLEFWEQFHGPFYGFDHVELARNHTNEQHVGQHYALWLESKGLENWRDYFLPAKTNQGWRDNTWMLPEQYHQDAWIAERTNDLLEEYKVNDTPFFLWASFFDPHDPYLVPATWDKMYDPKHLTVPTGTDQEHLANPPHYALTQTPQPDFSAYRESGHPIHGLQSHVRDQEKTEKNWAAYYGMISLMDKYIGSILDKLDELGLTDNTIVVFTSDHGDLGGHHRLITKGPFHYEDLIRVPFVVRYPGVVGEGIVSDAMQSLVDLSPTLLSFCNIDIPNSMTGVNQRETWEGNTERARDHIICENHHEPTTVHLKTYVNHRYKMTVYFNQTYGELYDLQEDPEEFNNLWDDPCSSDIKADLLLKFLWAEMGKEQMNMPRIAVA